MKKAHQSEFGLSLDIQTCSKNEDFEIRASLTYMG